MVRWLTAGESHGEALVAIIEGLPAGIEVTTADIGEDLRRRRLGAGRGARMAFEQDAVRVLGGVRHGRTLGSPIAIEVGNSEWPKWQAVMSADPVDEEELAALARNAPLSRPRPGHADLVGMQKYGFDDARPVLERVLCGPVEFMGQAIGTFEELVSFCADKSALASSRASVSS